MGTLEYTCTGPAYSTRKIAAASVDALSKLPSQYNKLGRTPIRASILALGHSVDEPINPPTLNECTRKLYFTSPYIQYKCITKMTCSSFFKKF